MNPKKPVNKSISMPEDFWEFIDNTCNETKISRSAILQIAFMNYFGVKINRKGEYYYTKAPTNTIIKAATINTKNNEK